MAGQRFCFSVLFYGMRESLEDSKEKKERNIFGGTEKISANKIDKYDKFTDWNKIKWNMIKFNLNKIKYSYLNKNKTGYVTF